MQKYAPPNPLTRKQGFPYEKLPFSLRLTPLPVHPNPNPHIYAKPPI